MKKIFYVICAITIVLSIIFVSCLGRDNNNTDETTNESTTLVNGSTYEDSSNDETTSENGGNSEDSTNPTSNNTDTTNQNSSDTTNTQNTDETTTERPAGPMTDEEIFDSQHFNLKGSMLSEGQYMPCDISISGNNMRMLSGFDGIEIAILFRDGKYFLIYPSQNFYIEMSSTVMKMMGLEEMEPVDFGMESSMELVKTTEVQKGGKALTCNEYADPTNNKQIKRYTDGTKLVNIETYENGVLTSDMRITSLTSDVPAEHLGNPDDFYEKKSYASLISALMKDMRAAS